MNKKVYKLLVTSYKGFTLVELLVVISIIVILGLIGISVYADAQGKAADAKRRADVDSITKAYEQKYDALSGNYSSISGTDFSSANGTMPTPPDGGNYTGCIPANSTATGFLICAQLEGFDSSGGATCPAATGNNVGKCYCKPSTRGVAPSTSAGSC